VESLILSSAALSSSRHRRNHYLPGEDLISLSSHILPVVSFSLLQLPRLLTFLPSLSCTFLDTVAFLCFSYVFRRSPFALESSFRGKRRPCSASLVTIISAFVEVDARIRKAPCEVKSVLHAIDVHCFFIRGFLAFPRDRMMDCGGQDVTPFSTIPTGDSVCEAPFC